MNADMLPTVLYRTVLVLCPLWPLSGGSTFALVRRSPLVVVLHKRAKSAISSIYYVATYCRVTCLEHRSTNMVRVQSESHLSVRPTYAIRVWWFCTIHCQRVTAALVPSPLAAALPTLVVMNWPPFTDGIAFIITNSSSVFPFSTWNHRQRSRAALL